MLCIFPKNHVGLINKSSNNGFKNYNKFSNAFARNYDDYIQNCNWVGTDILFGLMAEYISHGQSLLDIGIGTGLCSALFKRYGLNIYGIDGAEEMINICRDKNFTEELRKIDISSNELWFENKTFDHAVSHGVFHLIGDLKNIFKQTSLILNNGGCFAFTYERMLETAEDYNESDIAGLFERQNKQSGIKVFRHSENYIMELLVMHGFQLYKNTEFLAFVDSSTKTKTYFNAIIARKK